MLVPVQFPRNLVIAHHREIKKRNLEPGIERRTLAMNRIKMPVNLFELPSSVHEREVEIFVSQHAETMGTDLVGLTQNLRRLAGKVFAQQLGAL